MKIRNKIIAVLGILLFSIMTINVAFADSGWDSSYDSGGSWDSGSSWDSGGSSWDYDYGSSSGGSYSDGSVIFTIIIFVVIIFIIIAVCSSSNSIANASALQNSESYHEISEEELKKLLPEYSLEQLKDELYNDFIDIQNAWMNFEYDKLRELCTDELYNSYKSQLDVLKIKNGKNIMDSFNKIAIKITDVKEENGILSVSCYLAVSFKDYVINTTDGKITRGNGSTPLVNCYIMKFVRDKDSNSTGATKCPSCGAPVEGNTSTECEYCGSTLVYNAKKFVLSKKTIVK